MASDQPAFDEPTTATGSPATDPARARLNPTQAATLDALGAGAVDARLEFPADLATRLRNDIEAGLEEAAATLEGERPVVIAKRLLNGVHGCQAQYLDERVRPFEPSAPVVRGSIAHKALELAVHWPGTPFPLDLVDAAIERVAASEHWAADFLTTAAPADRAELRSSSTDLVTKFVECWPPLTAAMRPATEVSLSSEICGGHIILKGQADLTLGQPVGSGTRARKIIVDYKTGGRSPDHRTDLRFYALVETLRLGVPPRLLVTSYLTSGTLEVEPVTLGLLDATVARVVDGVTAFLALRAGEIEPRRRPSTACRWCPLLDDCAVGQAYLDDPDG